MRDPHRLSCGKGRMCGICNPGEEIEQAALAEAERKALASNPTPTDYERAYRFARQYAIDPSCGGSCNADCRIEHLARLITEERERCAEVPRAMIRECIADVGSAPPCCASTCEAIARKIEGGADA